MGIAYVLLGLMAIISVVIGCSFADFVEQFGTALTILGLGITIFFWGPRLIILTN